jgi:curved DNA-binding protein CbpA
MSISVNDYIKYDLYQVFLLNKSSFTISLLRKAYQRQVLIYHPDKFPSNLTEDEQKEKMNIFLLINNGYSVLSNDVLRVEYDQKRENYLNEEKGFGTLKSQFHNDKSKYTLSKEELEIKRHEAESIFKKQMEEMNAELEKQALNNPINTNTNIPTNIVVSESEDKHLLVPEKVTKIEAENFDTELSNITQNRNIKLENDGFMAKAPIEVVQEIRERLAQTSADIESITAQLAALPAK